MIRYIFISLFIATFLFVTTDTSLAQGQEDQPEWIPELTEDWTPVEDSVRTDAPGEAPSDAIVLFDGTDLSEWTSAGTKPRVENGAVTAWNREY